jgi:post-segregation antitoxin (ccd killing protein)
MRAEAALLELLRLDGGGAPLLSSSEWDRLLGLAVREQVAPLILRKVRDRPGTAVPTDVIAGLEGATRRSADLGDAARRQLAAVVSRLRQTGIEAALVKGAALAWFVYPDPALRPFNDLDLLILTPEREAAGRALRAAGYATSPVGSGGRRRAGQEVYWDPSWRRVPVDVHWRLDAPPLCLGLRYHDVLARARLETDGTGHVLILSPADTVVALSAHFISHLWESRPRVRYLRDIAEVARRYAVDWSRVARTAVETPIARSTLRLALTAAARLMGGAVPDEILRALAPPRGAAIDRRLSEAVGRRILRRDSPLAALFQVTLTRWLDGDAPGIYPKLAAAVFSVQSRRVLARVQRAIGIGAASVS